MQLRFQPRNNFNRVFIFYLPSLSKPSEIFRNEKYFYEYLVPWRSMVYFFGEDIEYIPVNVLEYKTQIVFSNTDLYVLSCDFSHFLDFQDAIDIENKSCKVSFFAILIIFQLQNILMIANT